MRLLTLGRPVPGALSIILPSPRAFGGTVGAWSPARTTVQMLKHAPEVTAMHLFAMLCKGRSGGFMALGHDCVSVSVCVCLRACPSSGTGHSLFRRGCQGRPEAAEGGPHIGAVSLGRRLG